MKIIDTDIFIDLLRAVKDAEKFFSNLDEEIAFSAITEGELISGRECDNAKQREDILHFLAQFGKIPVDNPLIQIAGDIRREFGVKLPDAIIAASALTTGAVLITRNLSDFKKIKNLKVERPY